MDAICGLRCSVAAGPTSPMRGGSQNNIYVIPAPHRLTFGMGMLIAAACCIPAILSLVSMWNKILEINWKKRWGNRNGNQEIDQLIDGTNGATIGKMKSVNDRIKAFLSVVEIPLSGTAVLAILIIGEMNFSSEPVWWQVSSHAPYIPSSGFVLDLLFAAALPRSFRALVWEGRYRKRLRILNCN
jgi:hypothetical protein